MGGVNALKRGKGKGRGEGERPVARHKKGKPSWSSIWTTWDGGKQGEGQGKGSQDQKLCYKCGGKGHIALHCASLDSIQWDRNDWPHDEQSDPGNQTWRQELPTLEDIQSSPSKVIVVTTSSRCQ